jgi:peroxiredoxin
MYNMRITVSIIVSILLFFDGSQSFGIDKKYLNGIGIQELKEEAPDFYLVDSNGKRISLKDFKGKVVILHLWATWCKPCETEFPEFEKMYQGLNQDAVFLPIAIDTNAVQKDIDEFAKKHGASFPVYLAREGNVTNRYWTWGVPVTYFIDKNGLIAGRVIGPRRWGDKSIIELINSLLKEK